MCDLKLASIVNAGNDVLGISGLCVTHNVPLVATGWVSATTNYYTPDLYCEGDQSHEVGKSSHAPEEAVPVTCAALHLVDGAAPRSMTPDEVQAYGLRVLTEQNPRHAPEQVAPLFHDPAVVAEIDAIRAQNSEQLT